MPRIIERVRAEAPGIEVALHNYRRDIFDQLDSGSIDLIFADAETPLPPRNSTATAIGKIATLW